MIDWDELDAAYIAARARRRMTVGAALLELARCSDGGPYVVTEGGLPIAEVRTDDLGSPVALLVAL